MTPSRWVPRLVIPLVHDGHSLTLLLSQHFVNTKADTKFAEKLAGEIDLIVCTASSSKLPLNDYLSTLGVHGEFIYVGMPESEWPALRSQTMASNGAKIGSSHIGSKEEILAMLDLVAEKKIVPWVKTMPMKDAAKAISAIEDGSVRYRTVLVQDIDK